MITIIDNFLDESHCDELLSIVTDMKFPWFRIDTTAYHKDDEKILAEKNFGNFREYSSFRHFLIGYGDDGAPVFSDWSNIPSIQKFLDKLLNNTIETRTGIFRFAVNCIPQIYEEQKDLMGLPHLDHYSAQDNYLTAIYYLHDSPGETTFFKNNPTYSSKDEIDYVSLSDFDVDMKVESKRNRLVYFDANNYHSAPYPGKEFRFVFNLILKKLGND